MKKIGFLTNHISYGGTDIAVYDYAHFNETILKNRSVILTRDLRNSHGEIYAKFSNRFPVFYIQNQRDIDRVVVEQKLDCLYVAKSGEVDWFYTTRCKCIIHCIFTTRFPHGSVYCALSPAINNLYGTNFPVLPYMVNVESNEDSFRDELHISKDTTVIGRYGSFDSFDIPFVHSAVLSLVNRNPSLLFVFMNTREFATHPQIVYLPRTTEYHTKRKFINTCDVMLHARFRGETFGLACGEFAVCKKPIITYAHSPEKAHTDILGSKALLYSDKESLEKIIENAEWKTIDMNENGYLAYTPNVIIDIFRRFIE